MKGRNPLRILRNADESSPSAEGMRKGLYIEFGKGDK